MSSNENISRQINTALEMMEAQKEYVQEHTHSDVVTRETKQTINTMDLAKMKIKAMRRATIKRQGSSFNLDRFKMNQQIIEDNKVKEENNSSNASNSSNTVVDGEVVKKRSKSKFKEMVNPDVKDDSYKLKDTEKIKIQEETYKHIDSIIKQVKKDVKQNHTYYMAKYGRPENMVVRRRICRSTLESPRPITHFKSQSALKLRNTYYATQTSSLKDPSDLKIKKPSELASINQAYQTMNQFYPSTPQKADFHEVKHTPYNMTANKWMKVEKVKSNSTNFTIPEHYKAGQRTQTVSTGFSGIRNFNDRKGSNDRMRPMRSINSASSLTQFNTPVMTNANSRGQTPFQTYKVKQKSKRKIFTNQLVQSKNKIIPTGRITEFVSKIGPKQNLNG